MVLQENGYIMQPMKLITSAQNDRLKYLSKLLSQAKARRASGQTVLEGVHLLQAYLQAGSTPVQVYIPESKLQQREILALIAALPEQAVTSVANAALSRITSLSEADDIMTLINIPAQDAWPVNGDCVVLDRIQDPGNVGTVMRSTAAAGVGCLVVGIGSADVWSPKVLRAAMGAHFLLKIHTEVRLAQWISSYRDKVWATALHHQNNHNLYNLDLHQSAAWIFGNEGSGVDDNILDQVSGCVRIPMAGKTESLNVAMAATVCLFEQMRQRQAKQLI